MAFKLVYGANFRCVLHHFSSLTRLKGSCGQLWPKTCPKHSKTKSKMIIFPRGLAATEEIVEVRPLFGQTWPKEASPKIAPSVFCSWPPRGPPRGRVPIVIVLRESCLLSVKQPFCILAFGLDQALATKWNYNWSTGLILGAFCNICRA